MSWLFIPDLERPSWERSSVEAMRSNPKLLSRTGIMPWPISSRTWNRDTYLQFLSGMTLPPSMLYRGDQRVDLVLANFAHLGLEDIPLNLGELLVGLGSPRVIMEFRPEVLTSRDGFIAFCGRLQSLDFELSITEISASDLGLQHGRKRLFMVLTPVSTGSHVANPRQQGMERRSGLGKNSQENQAGQRSRLIGDSDPSMDRVERLIRQLPVPPAPRDTEDWKHVLESWPDFSPTLPESVDGHFHGMADGISDRMERLYSPATS